MKGRLTARPYRLIPDRWSNSFLWRELDGQHVAVVHQVVAALEAQRAAIARAGVATSFDERVPADDLGADEALLDVGVDLARGVPGGQPVAQVPALGGFGLTGREEGDQLEQAEGAVDDAVQAGLADAELLAHHRGLFVVTQVGKVGLDARGDRHRARAR